MSESIADLERELEHYQEMLHGYDRSLQANLPRSGKPALLAVGVAGVRELRPEDRLLRALRVHERVPPGHGRHRP